MTSRRAQARVVSTSSVTQTRTKQALVVSRGPDLTCARASATACAPIQLRQTPSATSPPARSICSLRAPMMIGGGGGGVVLIREEARGGGLRLFHHEEVAVDVVVLAAGVAPLPGQQLPDHVDEQMLRAGGEVA